MKTINELNAEIIKAVSEKYPDKLPVLGEGCINAAVMFLGEAPGRDEVIQGRPFAGKAGKNLDDILFKIKISREKIYITNTVKFRPTKTSAKGTISNRPPKKSEVEFMLPFALEEIEIISPKIIVTLGNTPLKALMGDKANIGGLHAKPINYKNCVLFPIYHPAALIYKPALAKVFEQDFFALARLIQSV